MVSPSSQKSSRWEPRHCQELKTPIKVCSDAFILFEAWDSLTVREPRTKVLPGGLVLRIFTSWKNLSTLVPFEPTNFGRTRHPKTTKATITVIASKINFYQVRLQMSCKPRVYILSNSLFAMTTALKRTIWQIHSSLNTQWDIIWE